MGYTIGLSVNAKLRTDTPHEVLDYLRSLIEAPSADDAAAHESLAEQWASYGRLPEPDWFHGPEASGRLVEGGVGVEAHWWFQLAAFLHDEFVQHQYALVALLAAHHAEHGPFALSWTSLNVGRATTYVAHEGHLFAASIGNGLQAISPLDPAPEPPADPTLRVPDRRTLRQHGVPDGLGEELIGASSSDPALARFLLARTILRAVLEEDDVERQVGERIGRRVLAALDAGRDPLAAGDARGWGVVEHDLQRLLPATGRRIDDVSSALPTVLASSLDAGPTHLVAGTEIRALASFELIAKSRVSLARYGRGTSSHALAVVVPEGAMLTITERFDLGHAAATSADWPEWVTGPAWRRPATPDNPGVPVGSPDDYALQFISPNDEGTLFEVISTPDS